MVLFSLMLRENLLATYQPVVHEFMNSTVVSSPYDNDPIDFSSPTP